MSNKKEETTKPKEITQEQLIRVLSASKKSSSSLRYGFILGAGASVDSNIPSGAKLAKKWYEEIKEDLSDELLKEWANSIQNFDDKNLAEFYTKIFAKRFEVDYQAGYEELQRYMDKAEPSIGYSFLAQVLDETPNKFVITTNFDTMVEDALFGLKKSKPLVLGHELLSKYINPVFPSRPTIVKIHRDFLFDPYNDDKHITALDKQWEESLAPVLNENAMIVIGYGGNDDSLMNYLKDIENRKPIYWCYRGDKDKLTSKIKEVLTEKDFIVQIKGFDKLMLTINDKLEFDNIIDTKNISNSIIVQNAIKYANKYEKQLENLTQEELNKEEQKAIKKLLPSWWDYQLQVQEEKDKKKQESIYLEGLKAHPNSHELMGNYATLLKKLNRDVEAETYYLKALDLDPNSAINNGNYASLLKKLNRDVEAETYYLKALDLDPNSAINNGNYASLLHKLNRDVEAETYYLKALDLDPNDADYSGNYASLLHKLNRDVEAETYYLKALDLDPNHVNNNGNYATLLKKLNRDDEAETYYLKALDLDPNDADYSVNYAILLQKLERDDEAEIYYLKALDIDPNDADYSGNYAQFLLIHGKIEKATPYIEKAFINPKENDLTLELWFYRLAHYSEYFEEAQKELDRLLKQGIKSIGWDFNRNITQAKKENHPNIKLLEEYADKITKQ